MSASSASVCKRESCDKPHKRCSGHNNKGNPCGGQPIDGGPGTCRIHTPKQAKLDAAVRHAIKTWAPDMTLEDPGEIMLRMVTLAWWRFYETSAELADKQRQLAASIEDVTVGESWGENGMTEYIKGLAVYEAQWGKLAMEWAAAAHKAGVEERRVGLAERDGEMAGQMVRRVLEAMDLTAEQRALIPGLIREHLTLIIGGAA